jgi:type I restriction enzyme M protein
VKANVLFFDRKPAAEKPWTEKLWIYDLRTNKHFTLKENPLKRADLDDFVDCYFGRTPADVVESDVSAERKKISAGDSRRYSRHERKESERFKSFTYEELTKRDKLNLDIFWLKDESLEDSANLPDPAIIAAQMVEDLEAALLQFSLIVEDLRK